MDGELNLWTLVVTASPVVQFVMAVLAVMALGCWFIIGAKAVRLRQAASQSNKFLDSFWDPEKANEWDADRLESVYSQIKDLPGSPLASLFRAGYVELARIADRKNGGGDSDNVDRALRRSKSSEFLRLESALPFLATTAATAPFIGLFGTVWGIMNAFIAINRNDSVGLQTVAPGIAEALVATAMGLAAAVPAVMAYNYLLQRIRVLESEAEAFSIDYLNIVRRHFLSR